MPAGFRQFLARAAVGGLSSHFWDPGMPTEEEGYAFLMPLDPSQHDAIVAAAEPFVSFLAAVGGEQLVVRPAPSAWMTGPLDDDAIRLLGALWNRVGARAREAGVGLALHYDCLGGIHSPAQLETLLDATDPALVGLALDTAEFMIAGIDPLAFYRAHSQRVTHVHLKDVRDTDAGDEYLTPGAEQTMPAGRGVPPHRALVLRARHRGRSRRREGLRRCPPRAGLRRVGGRGERPRRRARRDGDAQLLVRTTRTHSEGMK
ncbi:sugar phosphate isomerase/epimerase family protein [Microbacterium elymi]|uniref:sugar phosphate isomerase/epimerase family protein n=1 Tax=Microbacterium elymi TaxID=2909587 RepID=UPI00339005F9